MDGQDGFIYLSLTLSKLPSGSPSPKPVSIPLAHPIYGPQYDTRACLFVKDPETETKQQFDGSDVPCLAEVMGFDRLKKEFH